jgi:hypothetical protein
MKTETAPTLLKRPLGIAAAGLLLLAASPSFAVDLTWLYDTGSYDWNTSSAYWNNGTSDVAWTNGDAAIFNGFSASSTLTLAGDITASSITRNDTNGTSLLTINGGGYQLDVTTISALGSAGDIKVQADITGDHDLTLIGPSTSYGQTGTRIQLVTASSYTGNTYIKNYAYVLADAYTNNTLPTSTVLDIEGGSTFFMKYHTQTIQGLTGDGSLRGTSQSPTSNVAKLVINTQAGVTTTFTGTTGSTSDSLYLEITGSGTQRFSNGYVSGGSITVSGGTLDLGGDVTAAPSVTISGGNLLSDAGETIALGVGTVSMTSGSITPGGVGSAGTMTVAADQAFNVTGGTLNMDVGTSSDQILGSGSGTYSLENMTIALTTGDGFDYNSVYTLLSGFASGTYDNITITGYDTANWLAQLDASNGNLSLSFVTVPEPSTYALIFGGLLGLIALKRRA